MRSVWFLLALTTLVTFPFNAGADRDVVVIGVDADMSGGSAQAGEAIHRGAARRA